MAGQRDRERHSTARHRAEERKSGFSTTLFHIPDGLNFWEKKAGTHTLDIIPYKVKRCKHDAGGNPFVEENGVLHYERTLYVYYRIGVEEKSYICPSKTFGKPDFVKEWRDAESKKDGHNADLVKSFSPKERQLFLVWDHADKGKGVQLMEFAYACFGTVLDDMMGHEKAESRGWWWFYYPDEDGMTLELTLKEDSFGGRKFLTTSRIDFERRGESLPDKIVNHGYDLDDLLVDTPYEVLKKAFLGISDDNETTESDKPARKQEKPSDNGSETPAAKEEKRGRGRSRKTESEPDPEPVEFQKGDIVEYGDKTYSFMKMKGDKCLLFDEDNDEMFEVNPSKCSAVFNKSESKKDKQTTKAASDDSDKDEDWDADFD